MASPLLATPSTASTSSLIHPATPPKRLRRSTRTASRTAPSPPPIAIAFPSRGAAFPAYAPPSPPYTRADIVADMRGEAFSRRRSSISSFDSSSSEAPSLSSSCSTSSRSSSIASISSGLLSPLPAPSEARRPCKSSNATSDAPNLGDGVRSMSLFTLIAFDEPPRSAPPSLSASLSSAASRRIPSPPRSPSRPRSLKRFSELPEREVTPPAQARLALGPAISARRHPRPASISIDSSSLTRPSKRRSIIRASQALADAVA